MVEIVLKLNLNYTQGGFDITLPYSLYLEGRNCGGY